MAAYAPFDFAHWMQLAGTNPERFERARQAAIEELIEAAPPGRRERLRGLQWRIDQERRRARTPLAACLRLSSLMRDSLNDELLPVLQRLVAGGDWPGTVPPRPAAVIIPFRRR
jgi:hypothetical protein